MIEHLVFFLEEPSAQDFLQALLPRVLPPHITPHFLVFEGKQDLGKRRLIPSYQKREGARTIAPHLDPIQNKSSSFRVLMRTLQTIHTHQPS